MNATVGQVSDSRYVFRHYEESHIRARLVVFADPSDTDKYVGHAVEWRIGCDERLVDARYVTQIFDTGHSQFLLALETYINQLAAYLNKGVLPS